MDERIRNLLRNTWTLPAVTGVAGFGFGTLVGYMFTKKQYNLIERELEIVREDQHRIDRTINERERGFNVQIAQAVALTKEMREAGEKLLNDINQVQQRRLVIENEPSTSSDQGGRTYHIWPTEEQTESEEQQPELTVVRNVFDNAEGDEWDYKTEIENRDRSVPYIIHVDEYEADEMGWDSRSTLTWYEKDQILADERDAIIYNVDAFVGDNNFRFGHGSNDPNVVYIRNEQMQAEYEVLRDAGAYQEIILGEQLEAEAEERELKHSHTRKFRSD